MVIVHVIGGLGNQLFQYAAGRAVAIRKQTTLKLDISDFASYPLRPYSLSVYNIIEEFAGPQEIERFQPKSRVSPRGLRHRVLRRLLPYYRWPVFQERSLENADLNLFKVHKDVYLKGYWQSELYFADIAGVIRCEFTLKEQADERNGSMLAAIEGTNSVNLHIRRGDYVADATVNQMHGAAGLDYYAAAIQHIAGQVPDPHFFIFSDDMPWVKENLVLPFPCTYVEHNGAEKAHEDLRLMSHCKHHIIANSSFSWWGAWLSTFPGKVVVAPRKWFAAITVDPASRYPKGWHIL